MESYTDADGKQKWRSAADGSSWAEKEVARIQDTGGLSKEKVLWSQTGCLFATGKQQGGCIETLEG